MSLFDPHRLYRKQYRKSHKGQIIQQRPVEEKTAISQQDIDKAIKLVRSLNLTVGREIPFLVPFYGIAHFVWDTVTIPSTLSERNSVFLTVNNFLSQIPATDDFYDSINRYLSVSHGQLSDISLTILMRSEHFTVKPKQDSQYNIAVNYYPYYPTFFSAGSSVQSNMGNTTEVTHIVPTLTSTTTIRFDRWEQPYSGSGANASATTTSLAAESKTGSLSAVSINFGDVNTLFMFLATKRVPEAVNEHIHDMSFIQASTSYNIEYEMGVYTTFDVIIDGKMVI